MEEARREAEKIGYPLLVRPSFVLGGRAMEICYDAAQLERFVAEAFVVADGQPVLIDQLFGRGHGSRRRLHQRRHDVVVPGIMEHIEEAGDSLWRLGLCDSAVQFAGAGDRRDSCRDGCIGEGVECHWPDECAIRSARGGAGALGTGDWGKPASPQLSTCSK